MIRREAMQAVERLRHVAEALRVHETRSQALDGILKQFLYSICRPDMLAPSWCCVSRGFSVGLDDCPNCGSFVGPRVV